MRLRVRPLLVAALLELAALAWLAHGSAVPDVQPATAAWFEGQGPVRMAGVASGLHPASDGQVTLELQAGGAAIQVHVAGAVAATDGTWLVAEGRVLRVAGRLTLWVDAAADVEIGSAPAPEQPSWLQIAQDPNAWHDRFIRLTGTVDRGAIADKEGHRLQLGGGPWPSAGTVTATGFLAYAPACLYDRFTAGAVEVVGAA